MEIIIYLLAFIFLITIVVGIHEGGHYFAARSVGIPVTHFAIGMGPVLASKQIGGTRYELRCVPIGGFVKMLGDADITSSQSSLPSNDPSLFQNRSRLVKSWVIFAGPLFNFILGIVIFTSVFYFIPHRQIEPIVSTIAMGSAAERGSLVGDRILKINRHTIADMDVRTYVTVALDDLLTFY